MPAKATRFAVSIFAAGLTLLAAQGIPLSEYRDRREALRKSHADGTTILFAAQESERGDLQSAFTQDPNFLYLTGWTEPGAVLVVAPDRDILFLPRRNPEVEKWTGRKHSPDDPDIAQLTGFEHVLPVESFEAKLSGLIESKSRIYAIQSASTTAGLRALLPFREFRDAALAIAQQRMKKSASELKLMTRAIDISMDAHRAAWRRIAAGVHEYQVAATMGNVYFDAGCERHAYPPIVASGPNSTVLHYSRNSRRMDAGETVVMDVGAQCSGYAADITRTVPVGGKFSARQRELYEIVLGAQKAAIEAVKPGMTIGRTTPNSLYKVALDYIDAHGKDRHGNSLGRYFTHGVGHHVGLEVHDANDPALPLAAGMVITIEPGIYIPEEGIGVRIEDMILVTDTGARVLSAPLPKEPAEIERAMAK